MTAPTRMALVRWLPEAATVAVMETPTAPSGVAAASWGPGRLDLFWVDGDRALWHQAWTAGAWQAAESLGGEVASSPAVTAWAEGQLEVFAIMADGALWDRYWD